MSHLTCFLSDCGPLLDPVNGSVNISSGTTFSKKAFYSCNSGFRVTGGNIRICTADGWSGMAPVCTVTGNRMEHSLLVVDIGHTLYGLAVTFMGVSNCNNS